MIRLYIRIIKELKLNELFIILHYVHYFTMSSFLYNIIQDYIYSYIWYENIKRLNKEYHKLYIMHEKGLIYKSINSNFIVFNSRSINLYNYKYTLICRFNKKDLQISIVSTISKNY